LAHGWDYNFFKDKSRLANVAKFKKEEKEENHVELKDEMLLHYAKRKAQELPEVNYLFLGIDISLLLKRLVRMQKL